MDLNPLLGIVTGSCKIEGITLPLFFFYDRNLVAQFHGLHIQNICQALCTVQRMNKRFIEGAKNQPHTYNRKWHPHTVIFQVKNDFEHKPSFKFAYNCKN